MKKIIRRSLRITLSYCAGVFLFTFFLIAPISMENNRNIWIAVYSFIFFIFTVIFLYKQMWKEGEIEKRENEGVKPKWYRGFIYGFVGFVPFLIFEIIYFLVYPNMHQSLAASIFHAVFRCSFGPMYFIIRFLNHNWYAFLIASLVIPLTAFLGFITGASGVSARSFIKSRRKKEEDFLD